jgi:hypothetical protein
MALLALTVLVLAFAIWDIVLVKYTEKLTNIDFTKLLPEKLLKKFQGKTKTAVTHMHIMRW